MDLFIDEENMTLGIKIFQSSLKDFKPNRKYDLITSNHSFEHMDNQLENLKCFENLVNDDGKYNYIDIQDGSEISPIDFDSVTLMNPDDGSFQIEYNGAFFDACLDGFYVDDEGYTFDELPNFA